MDIEVESTLSSHVMYLFLYDRSVTSSLQLCVSVAARLRRQVTLEASGVISCKETWKLTWRSLRG